MESYRSYLGMRDEFVVQDINEARYGGKSMNPRTRLMDSIEK